MLDYLGFIYLFTFDTELLVRMIRDIVDDFILESKHLLEANPRHYSTACKRLSWAHEFYQQLTKDLFKKKNLKK